MENIISNDVRKKESFIKAINNDNQPTTLASIVRRVLDKTWYSKIYDKRNGVKTLVMYASFKSTNLSVMYGDRIVESLKLLKNGDFEIYLGETVND